MEQPPRPQIIPNTPVSELERIQTEQLREHLW